MSTTEPEKQEGKTDQARAVVSEVFDRASGLLSSRVGDYGDEKVNLGLLIGAGLAALVAALVRDYGAEEAKRMIEELNRDRNEGRISDEDVTADNKRIAASVKAAFDEKAAKK